jgi:glycosyltransferase involved in cell wall biosynthesis
LPHGCRALAQLSDSPTGLPHVAVLAAEFPPVGGGGVIRVVKLVKYLSNLGWQITVVSSDERLANAYDESLLAQVPPEVRVMRPARPLAIIGGSVARGARERLGRRSLIIRALRLVRRVARSLWAIPDHRLVWALLVPRQVGRHVQPDIVLSTGPPHSVHIGASILARRRRIPHVIDLRDEWTLRAMTRSRLPWRVFAERQMERWCMRRASRVVVVSHESRDRYAATYPEIADRLTVIPNGFDPEDLELVPSDRPPIGATLTLGYAGSFQTGQKIAPMFDAIGEVVRSGVDGRSVRFEMIGPFLPHELDTARRRIPSDRLTVRPFMPHRSALRAMAEWDGLCVIATDGNTSLAGKLYECLALRRPIVVIAPEGPATRLVRELNAGASGDPRDADSIKAAIATSLGMAVSFRGASEEDLAPYDRRRQAGRWSQLLRGLIEEWPTRRAA